MYKKNFSGINEKYISRAGEMAKWLKVLDALPKGHWFNSQ